MTLFRMKACANRCQDWESLKRCCALRKPESDPFMQECREHCVTTSRLYYWKPNGFAQAGMKDPAVRTTLFPQTWLPLNKHNIQTFPPSSEHQVRAEKDHLRHFWPCSVFEKKCKHEEPKTNQQNLLQWLITGQFITFIRNSSKQRARMLLLNWDRCSYFLLS